MKKSITIVTILLLAYASFINCQPSTSSANETEPPVTKIANIPVDADTLFPVVTFHWSGGDIDGFVAGYEYRYTTTFLSTMDSVTTDWTFTENTSETITFLSNDILNKQRLEVRAVDNDGKKDESPASKTIFTPRTFAPETQIISPQTGEERFALSTSSDWWPGIEVVFTASDEDGEIVEYGWSIDGGDFVWGTDTAIVITPDFIQSPISGEHIILVSSRDDTGLIDPIPDTARINLVEANFAKTLLILDDTDESNWQSGVDFSDGKVDSFYTAITASIPSNQITHWDYAENGIPSREILGQHKLLLWHADDRTTNNDIPISANKELLADYANVGGDLFISGWAIIKSLADRQPFPREFPDDDFVKTYLHINIASETPFLADFTEAVGVGDFNSIPVDTTKLDSDFRATDGGIYRVNLVDQRGPFTDVIHSYGTRDNSLFPDFRGQATSIIYYGTSFKSVVVGFPMFFMEQEASKTFFDQIIEELEL